MSNQTHVISATDANRTFSHVLNKVFYHGDSFEIKRGKEIIAKIIPTTRHGQAMKVKDLANFFNQLPHLDAEDARDFEKSTKSIRNSFPHESNPWE